MSAEVTAALIGAGATAAGAGASAAGAFTSAKRAYKYNKKLAEWQNEVNLQNWNLTNEYNAPSAQLQRLKEAGLNPLYYGLDGSSADAFEAASASPYVSPSIPNPFEGMQNLGIQLAQIDNLQANTAKTNNENLTETKRREQVEMETKQIAENLKNIVETRNLTVANRKLAEQSLDWNERLNAANLHYTEAAAKLSNSQVKRIETLLDNEKVIQSKTIEEFDHRWAAWAAAAAKDRALAGLTQKDIENYALIHMDSGFMGTGLSLRNLIFGAIEALDKIPAKGKPAIPDLMEGSSPVSDPLSNGGSR